MRSWQGKISTNRPCLSSGALLTLGKIDVAKLCVATLLYAFLPSQVSAGDALIWVTDGTYPPFVEVGDDGESTGLDRNVAEAVCRQIERRCEFAVVPWDDVIEGLRESRFDVAFSGLSETTVIAAGLAPSQAYFMTSARFVTRQENSSAVTLNSGAATIGVLAGTPHAAYLEAQVNDADRVKRFADEQEIYLSLLGGAIDAGFSDGLTLYHALILHPDNLPVVLTDAAVTDPEHFDPAVVFAVSPGNPLLSEVDGAINALDASGQLRAIIDAHLPGYLTP